MQRSANRSLIPPYQRELRDRFYESARSIVGYEIRPEHTITFVSEVDLTQVEKIRQSFSGSRKPTYTSFLAKAVATALQEFPQANRRRFWFPVIGSRLHQFKQIDIAVAAERRIKGTHTAVFIDVLRNADRLALPEITEWLFLLASSDEETNEQWRAYLTLVTKLPSWLRTALVRLPCAFPALWVKFRGAAAQISSPGKYGVEVMAASWTSPLGLSFGLVKERPVIFEGQVAAHKTFMLTLNWDRRVLSGSQAAGFFNRIIGILERGASFIPLNGPGGESSGDIKSGVSPKEIRESISEYEIHLGNIRPENTTTFIHEVDLAEIEKIRQAAAEEARPSYTAFVAKAAALALKEFPDVNRRVYFQSWFPLFPASRLQRFTRIDIAVGVEREIQGAMVPIFVNILRDADQLSLTQVTQWIKQLATDTTSRQWRVFSRIARLPRWLFLLILHLPSVFPNLWVKTRGGSVMIFSTAGYNIDIMTSNFSWPLGIAFNMAKERPAARNGNVVPAKTFTISMAWDRRVALDKIMAKFFNRFVEILEHAGTQMTPSLSTTTQPEAAAKPRTVFPSYRLELREKVHDIFCSIMESEINLGNTVTFLREVDLTEIEEIRKRFEKEKPSYTAFVAKTIALAMQEHPYTNRRAFPWFLFMGTRLYKFKQCDLTIAAEIKSKDAEVCVVASKLRNAENRSVTEISHWHTQVLSSDETTNPDWIRFAALVRKLPRWLGALVFRLPSLFPHLWFKYRGGAAFLRSTDETDVDVTTTAWPWPLGITFGAVKERPFVQDGKILCRKTFMLTLNWDRRVMAGGEAARFFNFIIDTLEHAKTRMTPHL